MYSCAMYGSSVFDSSVNNIQLIYVYTALFDSWIICFGCTFTWDSEI